MSRLRRGPGPRHNAFVLIVHSSTGYPETLSRLLDAIAGRGLTVFAQFDHAAAAREVDMDLPPETVVVFGNPRAGTPLMKRDPRIGIELPLRIVLWKRDEETMIGYNDPRELANVYDVGQGAPTLEAMAGLLSDLAQAAAA
jgi:uncharacterized protein (DUF302 family)